MFRFKLNLTAALLLAFALPVAAQNQVVEYGTIDELREVKKVFVDTGTDAQQRERITKEIGKRLPGLTIVARPEDSDIHLRFEIRDRQRVQVVGYPSPYPYPYPPYPQPHPQTRGRAPVQVGVGIPVGGTPRYEGIGTVVKIVGENRVRVLFSFRDGKGSPNPFEREPGTNFGRAFVKAYEKANGANKA
jgi:hypothetical protein